VSIISERFLSLVNYQNEFVGSVKKEKENANEENISDSADITVRIVSCRNAGICAETQHRRHMIGRRPYAAFGNSIGDKEMLEYTQAGEGARLMVLVCHDDADREYAYGPHSKVGTFTAALMAEAKQKGWVVISMKNDWNRIFAFEK
jgi:hypothetical protein